MVYREESIKCHAIIYLSLRYCTSYLLPLKGGYILTGETRRLYKVIKSGASSV